MDPISIALGLATVVPKIIGWCAGDKAEATATRVLDIAKSVTGLGDSRSAVDAILADPALALELQKAVMGLELALAQEDNKALAEINATMRVEATSEHPIQYSWRPACGFSMAIGFLVITLLLSYVTIMAAWSKDYSSLTVIPQIVGSFAALFACIAPVVGVASYKRGQEKIEKIKAGGQ